MKYFIMLLMMIWASFMFFGIQLAINMLFANLFLMSEFGFLGIVLYIPFILLFLLVMFPFYLLFKKIYNVVIRGSISFELRKINLFVWFIAYYGIPFFFSTIIASKISENYRTQTSMEKNVVIILSIIVILTLDRICIKILNKKWFKTNPRSKSSN